MGRLSQLLIFSSLSLVGGAALGETGLIVEPWRNAPPIGVVAAATAEPPATPLSGLAPVAAPSPRKPEPPAPETAVIAPAAQKWSPPIVELLVDPWASSPMASRAARSRWVPSRVEIIDPWASAASASARVASRPVAPPPSTIF